MRVCKCAIDDKDLIDLESRLIAGVMFKPAAGLHEPRCKKQAVMGLEPTISGFVDRRRILPATPLCLNTLLCFVGFNAGWRKGLIRQNFCDNPFFSVPHAIQSDF